MKSKAAHDRIVLASPSKAALYTKKFHVFPSTISPSCPFGLAGALHRGQQHGFSQGPQELRLAEGSVVDVPCKPGRNHVEKNNDQSTRLFCC